MADKTTTTDAAPQAGPTDAADPSMEEILASIRRILNEEEAPASPEAEADDAEDDDVLVLDQSMLVSPEPEAAHVEVAEKPQPVAQAVEPEEDDFSPPPLAVTAPVELPEPVVLAAAPETPARPAPLSADMLAPEAAAAAASSISTLVRTLSAGRSTQVYSAGPTLEDIVRGELRPLLKEWLDSYLPPMVERLVRTEIERVVGRDVP